MSHSRQLTALALGLAALAVGPGAAAASTTVLRTAGIGPLTLGMTRAAAVSTGWLGSRAPGCELASPRPVTYRFTGPKAPSGLRGTAEFDNGGLTNLSFTAGVRTATGVHLGTTTSRMVARYRTAGFSASARYVGTFQGTFVNVKRSGHQLVGGFGQRGRITVLAVPVIAVCE